MAVETLYRSTRDLETTFVDRKLADAHDQMLELAELLTDVLIKNVPGISEKHAEDASIYMAKNRAVFAAAFKNNATALSELSEPAERKPTMANHEDGISRRTMVGGAALGMAAATAAAPAFAKPS